MYVDKLSYITLAKRFPLFFGQIHGVRQVFVKKLFQIDCVVYIHFVCWVILHLYLLDMENNKIVLDIKIKEQDEASYMKFVVESLFRI